MKDLDADSKETLLTTVIVGDALRKPELERKIKFLSAWLLEPC